MLTPAVPNDHGDFEALLHAAFEPYATGLGRASAGPYPWLADKIDTGACFWGPGHDVGCVLERCGSVLEIEMLAVHPAAQGKGRGRSAMGLIEDHARRQNCQTLKLVTAQRYTKLVAFYSHQGFRVLSVGPHPRGYDDHLRVTMAKNLT